MISAPITPTRNPFVLPNFDATYSESESTIIDDPEIFYNDIQQSLNDDSKYKMNNRKKYIMQSQERSKMRLSSIYQERLQKLAKVQEQQILDLYISLIQRSLYYTQYYSNRLNCRRRQ